MVEAAIQAATSLVQFAAALRQQKLELDFQIKKIVILVTGIQRGLIIYKNITFQSQDQSIINLQNAIETSHDVIKRVSNRNCLTGYLQSGGDLKNLQQSEQLIDAAFTAIEKIAKLSSNGQIVKKSQIDSSVNEKVFEILKSKQAQTFWQNHVQNQTLPLPVHNVGDYFKSFLAQYNESMEAKENGKIKLMYLEPVIAKIVDSQSSGYVNLEEIERFFRNWWEDQDKRDKLRKKFDIKIGEKIDEYLFVYQVLREFNCEQYFPMFKFNKINNHIFLRYNQQSLIQAFEGQISQRDIAKISSAIEHIQHTINEYDKIQDECLKMKKEVDKIVVKTLEYKQQGKLKKTSKKLNGLKEAYYEYENGSGLTYIIDVENSVIIGRSLNFEPISSFFIQYDTKEEDGELNYANLTRDYLEYFGYYYILNGDLEKPFEIFAVHAGAQSRNDIQMYSMKKGHHGTCMGFTIIDRNITIYEVPQGRQLHKDFHGNYMVKYYISGAQVSFQEFQEYKEGNTTMNNDLIREKIKEQGEFLIEHDNEESSDNEEDAKETIQLLIKNE